MIASIEGLVRRLEAEPDAERRYIWVDMFCASQNLLGGVFLPADEAEKEKLKKTDEASYKARKEDTNNIFDDAIAAVGSSKPCEIFLYLSPLAAEWAAPPHAFLLPDRGEPPANWMRRGPGSITRCAASLSTASEPTPCSVLTSIPLPTRQRLVLLRARQDPRRPLQAARRAQPG